MSQCKKREHRGAGPVGSTGRSAMSEERPKSGEARRRGVRKTSVQRSGAPLRANGQRHETSPFCSRNFSAVSHAFSVQLSTFTVVASTKRNSLNT